MPLYTCVLRICEQRLAIATLEAALTGVSEEEAVCESAADVSAVDMAVLQEALAWARGLEQGAFAGDGIPLSESVVCAALWWPYAFAYAWVETRRMERQLGSVFAACTTRGKKRGCAAWLMQSYTVHAPGRGWVVVRIARPILSCLTLTSDAAAPRGTWLHVASWMRDVLHVVSVLRDTGASSATPRALARRWHGAGADAQSPLLSTCDLGCVLSAWRLGLGLWLAPLPSPMGFLCPRLHCPDGGGTHSPSMWRPCSPLRLAGTSYILLAICDLGCVLSARRLGLGLWLALSPSPMGLLCPRPHYPNGGGTHSPSMWCPCASVRLAGTSYILLAGASYIWIGVFTTARGGP